MKGWYLNGANDIELKELTNVPEIISDQKIKVKLTKTMITPEDVLRYTGETKVSDVVLGSAGIGVVADVSKEGALNGITKGSVVYVNPYKPCKECYFCKSNIKNKCSNLLLAGEDYNGFLREFVYPDISQVIVLPQPKDGCKINDQDALLIETISIALNTIDRLNIQKGEHVVIIGADTLGITLAKLLKYYQSIPIIIDNDPQKIALASECGIYYTLTKEKDWHKEVNEITGGRMANHVVYMAQSKIPVKTAFGLAGYGISIGIIGANASASPISFTLALKKELKLEFIANGYGNALASLNLIANEVIDSSDIKIEHTTFENCGEKFKELADKYKKDLPIPNVIVDMVGL